MNSMTSPQNVDSFINTVNNSSNFNYVINDNFYIFSATIYTFDGRLKDLNPQAIVKLSIEDDLTTPFHKGVMILDNSFDNIEYSIVCLVILYNILYLYYLKSILN